MNNKNNSQIDMRKPLIVFGTLIVAVIVFTFVSIVRMPKPTYSVATYTCCRDSDDFCWEDESDTCASNNNCTCVLKTAQQYTRVVNFGTIQRSCTVYTAGAACSVAVPAGPSKTGYDFTGWGTREGCTSGSISANTTISVTANYTYFPCYTEKPKKCFACENATDASVTNYSWGTSAGSDCIEASQYDTQEKCNAANIENALADNKILVTFRCDNGPDLDAGGQGRNGVSGEDDDTRDMITGPIIDQQTCIADATGKCKAGDIKAPAGYTNWWYLKTSCATTPDVTSSWINSNQFGPSASIVFFTCCGQPTDTTVTRSCYSCNVNGKTAYSYTTSSEDAATNTKGTNCTVVSNDKCVGSPSSPAGPSNPSTPSTPSTPSASSVTSACYLVNHKYVWATSKPAGGTLVSSKTSASSCTGCETGYSKDSDNNCVKPGSSSPKPSSNVIINPPTGTSALAIALIIGLVAIGYSFWYFKKSSN